MPGHPKSLCEGEATHDVARADLSAGIDTEEHQEGQVS